MHETEESRPSDNSWLITTCPSCSKQIKAKREILQSTSSIACPYCQHSLNVENESKYNSDNFQYAKAQKLTETPEKGIRKRKNSKKKANSIANLHLTHRRTSARLQFPKRNQRNAKT